MYQLTKECLRNFDECGESDIDTLRFVIIMMKARIAELEDEIEDIELQAKDDAQRTGG